MKVNVFTSFRILFGGTLMIWVGMGIFGWEPPSVADRAEAFHDAIFQSGYMIPSVLSVYFIAGVAFLFNRFVPLAAVLLLPVSLNILMFHAFMNPNVRSLSIAGALFAANCVMIFRYRNVFLPILRSTQ